VFGVKDGSIVKEVADGMYEPSPETNRMRQRRMDAAEEERAL
jgi:hypothetical protein